MNGLSISTAWNETAAFVSRHAGPLLTVAFAFIALPSIVFQTLIPQPAPGDASAVGILVPMILILVALSIVGTLAISALALGRENVVGSAIGLSLRRFLPLLGASLLVGLGGIVLMTIILTALGVDAENLTAPTPDTAGRVGLAFMLFLVPFLFVWVRLMLMTPIAAAEREGALGIMRRSWRLTAGRFWKLLGFVLLFVIAGMIVIMVITMLVGIVIALVAGRPEPGTVAGLLLSLVSGVVNAGFLVFFTTMIARIYAQLANGAAPASAAPPAAD